MEESKTISAGAQGSHLLGFLGHVLGHRGPWETLGVMTLGILGTGWGAGRLCAAGVTGPTPGVLCGRGRVSASSTSCFSANGTSCTSS